MILVAPWWPKRSWAIDIVDLNIELPRLLLSQEPGSVIFYQNPTMFKLHAWTQGDPTLSDLVDSFI